MLEVKHLTIRSKENQPLVQDMFSLSVMKNEFESVTTHRKR